MKSITENTAISLGVLGAIIGAVVWISYVAFQGKASADAIVKIDDRMSRLEAMSSDIAVIKERVERIDRKIGGSNGRGY